MNHSSQARLFLAAVCAIALTAHAEDEEDLSSLSAPIQKTAHEIIGSSKVEEVEDTYVDGQHATEVEFERNGKKMAIVISHAGKLIQTEDRMSPQDAPAAIKQAVAKQYSNGKITHIKSVDKNGEVRFEVSVSAGGESHQLKFDKNGKPLKASVKD